MAKDKDKDKDSKEHTLERVRKRIELFFPDEIYTRATIEEAIEVSDVFIKPTDILPYLQTALLDEKILEVELDGMTRVYFSRIYDAPPPPIEEEVDDEIILVEPDYQKGDYLKDLTHIISLPLEPGMGNIHIRYSKRIMFRMFLASYAVEIGCFFQDMTTIGDLPVLRLSFPSIGRIVRGSREFRAKVPLDHDLQVMVVGKRRQSTLTARVVDISASGVSFSIKKEEQQLFRLEETRTFEFVQDGLMMVRITGKVRHVTKIRGKDGSVYICGLQFDLVTRSLAAKVEAIVASVQRAYLKELSDLSAESGLELKT